MSIDLTQNVTLDGTNPVDLSSIGTDKKTGVAWWVNNEKTEDTAEELSISSTVGDRRLAPAQRKRKTKMILNLPFTTVIGGVSVVLSNRIIVDVQILTCTPVEAKSDIQAQLTSVVSSELLRAVALDGQLI